MFGQEPAEAPRTPTPGESSAENMAALYESLTPVLATADALRQDMVARGYSAEIAEMTAANLINQVLSLTFSPQLAAATLGQPTP